MAARPGRAARSRREWPAATRQAAFDTFGNLFLVYINGSVNQINVILSTDGGITFSCTGYRGHGQR